MTNEEKALQYFVIAIPENEEQANAYFYAKKYLNAAIQFALPSNPLSLEQLRKVPHGKIKDSTLQSICDRANEVAQPPAHIDREAWEKPCDMCGGKTTLYQHTNTTKLFMNTFGEASTLVTECMACPPYADCCMKGISANSAFKIKFCPECGRPLTDEAWAELEKRLRG